MTDRNYDCQSFSGIPIQKMSDMHAKIYNSKLKKTRELHQQFRPFQKTAEAALASFNNKATTGNTSTTTQNQMK